MKTMAAVVSSIIRMVVAPIPVLLIPAVASALDVKETAFISFDGENGAAPSASLVLGSDGELYGTTRAGGPGFMQGAGYYGTVFRTTRQGKLETLYSFSGGADGGLPMTALTEDGKGNYYGMTEIGGAAGLGTIFKITRSGQLETLHSFVGSDGAWPAFAPLTRGKDGNFYGVAQAALPFYFGYGQVGSPTIGLNAFFRITPDGDFVLLNTFPSDSGNDVPASLILGRDGNFYGTTLGLSFFDLGSGYGTVFRATPDGELTTLHSFGAGDGIAPDSLAEGADRAFYGTTVAGGASGNGTFFRITGDGNLTTLYSFAGGAEGQIPNPGLVRGRDGNFYGTTESAGASNAGTIFRISPEGVFTLLYSFAGGVDGGVPLSGLIPGLFGNVFYGTTQTGGKDNHGTVFRIRVPWETQPNP